MAQIGPAKEIQVIPEPVIVPATRPQPIEPAREPEAIPVEPIRVPEVVPAKTSS